MAQEVNNMHRLYKLTIATAEHSTFVAIIDLPEIKDGVVVGDLVGKFIGWDNQHNELFQRVEPVHFMAGGGPWTLIEYKGELQ
jgi:hypothetical protein